MTPKKTQVKRRRRPLGLRAQTIRYTHLERHAKANLALKGNRRPTEKQLRKEMRRLVIANNW